MFDINKERKYPLFDPKPQPTRENMNHIVKTWKLKNRESLLQNLADGLRELEASDHPPRLSNLKFTLFKGDEELTYVYSVSVILDWIVNDITWNEESDWSEADRLTVKTY